MMPHGPLGINYDAWLGDDRRDSIDGGPEPDPILCEVCQVRRDPATVKTIGDLPVCDACCVCRWCNAPATGFDDDGELVCAAHADMALVSRLLLLQ